MTLNYELAKSLKDAGFPQELKVGGGYHTHGKMPIGKKLSEIENLKVKVPTLEELIEACGDGPNGINRIWRVRTGGWAATGNNDFKDGVGTTPTEAVARLWLALNKK